MKTELGDNTLNNERLSLVMTKLPINKLANCNPYFTTLRCINNLKIKRSYKRKVNLKNLKFSKKSIERFKNYSLTEFVKEDQNVYKTANKSALMHTNRTLLSSNRLKLSPSWSFTCVSKKIETTMRWNCMSKALRLVQITVEHQDCPFFTVFLTIKTSSQNISITLLQISLKLHEHRGCYWRKKLP